jgi:hypothetical protein
MCVGVMTLCANTLSQEGCSQPRCQAAAEECKQHGEQVCAAYV